MDKEMLKKRCMEVAIASGILVNAATAETIYNWVVASGMPDHRLSALELAVCKKHSVGKCFDTVDQLIAVANDVYAWLSKEG